jgi:hypothetical protein
VKKFGFIFMKLKPELNEKDTKESETKTKRRKEERGR